MLAFVLLHAAFVHFEPQKSGGTEVATPLKVKQNLTALHAGHLPALQEVLQHARELSAALGKLDPQLLSGDLASVETDRRGQTARGLQDVLSQAKQMSFLLAKAEVRGDLPSSSTLVDEHRAAQTVENDDDTAALLARAKELSGVLAKAHPEHLAVKKQDTESLFQRAKELSAVLGHPKLLEKQYATARFASLSPAPPPSPPALGTDALLARAKELTAVLWPHREKKHDDLLAEAKVHAKDFFMPSKTKRRPKEHSQVTNAAVKLPII